MPSQSKNLAALTADSDATRIAAEATRTAAEATRTAVEATRTATDIRPVQTLFDGGAITVAMPPGLDTLTVITGALATATISRVDAADAAAHTAGAANQFTVAADTRMVLARDWPFYRISVAGGACRIATV